MLSKAIHCHNLCHSFDPKGMWALKNVSLSIDANKTTVLLGPSGIGKTTLLKILAGEIIPDSGEVTYQGLPLSQQRHRFAYIAQEWDVSTDDSVYEYLYQKAQLCMQMPEGQLNQHVRSYIELFHLQGQAQKSLKVLSTGQKARVVLASHLLHRPEIVLMDEPFAHLDRQLRRQLEDELKDILESWQAALILVTHNLEEAFEKAQEALIMIEGKLLKGDLREFYLRPTSAEVARFLGDTNLIASKILSKSSSELVLKNALGEFRLNSFCHQLLADKYSHAYLLIRPEAIQLVAKTSLQDQAHVLGRSRIEKIIFKGPNQLFELCDKQNLVLKSLLSSRQRSFKVGEEVSYLIDFNDLYGMKI